MKKLIGAMCGLFLWIFHFTIVTQHELPLVVIVTSYNNKDWYVKNLDSLFSQNYSNYRVIYIDDCSNDGTALLVESYLEEHGHKDRCLLIKNVQRSFKMANLWVALQLVKDNEIIVEYDGDDWFPDADVFSVINEVYQAGNVWLTYSDLVQWPDGKVGKNGPIPQSVIEKNSYRTYKGCFWQMSRTYYAWLAKEIALKDLLYEGQFLKCTSDAAMMFCMMEMAAGRFAYIKKPIYTYNVANILNDHKVTPRLQQKIEIAVRRNAKYQARQRPAIHKEPEISASSADILIFAHDKPEQLKVLVESLYKYVSGLGTICVMLETQSLILFEAYQEIFKEYPSIKITKSSVESAQVLSASPNKYVILAHEGCRLIRPIMLSSIISELERTKACAFFLTADVQTCPRDVKFINLGPTVSAWQFYYGQQHLKNPFSTSLSLYKKNTVVPSLMYIESKDEREFCYVWSQMAGFQLFDICLCFNEFHAIDSSIIQSCLYRKENVFCNF